MKTKKEMVKFLAEHFRYNTMNSWNQSTSYAKNIKIYKVIPAKYHNQAYEIMEQGDVYNEINEVLEDFAIAHNYQYQIGFNGRSGGYLVLYLGGRKKSEYKSYCTECGQKNFTEATPKNKKCGRCEKDKRINREFFETFTYPGKSIDQNEDFQEWSKDEITARYEIVRAFDGACQRVVKIFLDYCKNYTVKEKTIPTTKTIKVLQPIAA